jgi:hypothetical protein
MTFEELYEKSSSNTMRPNESLKEFRERTGGKTFHDIFDGEQLQEKRTGPQVKIVKTLLTAAHELKDFLYEFKVAAQHPEIGNLDRTLFEAVEIIGDLDLSYEPDFGYNND